MRKFTLIVILFVGALMLPNASKADSITATATYSWDTSNTLFSSAGKSISFSFNISGSVIPSTPYGVPLTVSYGGKTFSEAGTVTFFTKADGGLIDLYFWSGLDAYLWQFYGSQIFNSSQQLVAGIYPVDVKNSDYQDIFLSIFPSWRRVVFFRDGDRPRGSGSRADFAVVTGHGPLWAGASGT